jgi:hypothetical protein
MTKGGLVGERLRGYGIRMGAYMMRPTPSAPMAKREGRRDGPLWPKVGGPAWPKERLDIPLAIPDGVGGSPSA